MGKMGLNFKLNIYIISAFMVVFGITLAIIVNHTSNKAEVDAREYAHKIAKGEALFVQGYFEQALGSCATLSQSILALKEANYTDRELVLEMLKHSMEANEDYSAIWTMWEKDAFDGQDDQYAEQYSQEVGLFNASCYREAGELQFQNFGSEEQAVFVSDDDLAEYQEAYYSVPKSIMKQYIDDPSQYSFTGREEDMETTISLVSPIIQNQSFLGVLGVDLDFNTLMELNNKVQVFNTGFSSIITHNHIIAAHPKSDYLEAKIDTFFNAYNSELDECLNNGKEYIYHCYSDYLKTDVLRVFFPINIGDSGMFWSIMIEIPENEIMADSRHMTLIILIIGVISMLVMFVVVFYISRGIAKPITDISQVMSDISRGQLDVKIHKSGRGDEIGVLEQALQAMVEKIKEVVNSIQEGAANIRAASHQFSTASQQIASGANEQAASVEEISSTTEQIAANVDQNSSNAIETKEISTAAKVGIEDVASRSHESIEATRVIAEKISVINDIAFQTNILALNAAVEAARAGEHGKGFAVVAAEVRKLAENSRVAADEIVGRTANSLQYAENAGQKLEAMIPNVVKTVQLVEEIAAASGEQNTATTQVNASILELSNVTQQNSASAEELASSAEELASQAESLKDMVAFFKFSKD